MRDILERLNESSTRESSHELQCRCMDAAAEITRLRQLCGWAAYAIEDRRGAEIVMNVGGLIEKLKEAGELTPNVKWTSLKGCH
jgi:hypothetical protein